MLSTNLKRLRKIYGYTQEDLAEKINISRQSVAKWESGESNPDIESCIKLSKLYDVRLDDLVNYSEEESGLAIPPKGKYFFGTAKVGEQGEIIIPKETREVFNINTGDKLLILGDEGRGIGIVPQNAILDFVGNIGVVEMEKEE